MFKNNLFFAIFLFLSGHYSLWAQDKIILPFSHPSVVLDTVFTPFNQSIPKEVLKTKDESMVIIRVSTPHIKNDLRIGRDYAFGEGFTVWLNYVVTSLHLMGKYPALWRGNKKFPTVIEVSDGQAVFNASLADYDDKADLALLKINSPNEFDKIFQPKPARLAKFTTIQDPSLTSPRVLYEKFYAFAFFPSNPRLFNVAEIGPFLAVTNDFGYNYILDLPMGMLQGKVQEGFSGAPLLSPEGIVMGVMARTDELYSYVVLVENLTAFLTSAQKKLGLETEKPSVEVK